MASKDVKFSSDARALMLEGVDILANAVTGSGSSMVGDTDDAVVDRLEDALDEIFVTG